MIVAVFARTLRPDVTLMSYVEAWMPDSEDPYPAALEIAVDPSDDRRVVAIVRFDGSLDDFYRAWPRLVHAQALDRLAGIVATTDLQTIYETVGP